MRTLIASLAVLVSASTVMAQEASVEAENPKRLAVGKEGYFQPGALFQGWYYTDLVSDNSKETENMFRIRRAELVVKGQIVPRLVAYKVMIDPAKVLEGEEVEVAPDDPTTPDVDESITVTSAPSKVSVFQDFFITFLSDWADVSIGQFKIPVSWEGYNSSSKLLFPERAVVAKELGDERDLGMRIAKTFDYFGYSAGIFNGSGRNREDADDAKDVALRLEAYPIEGLVVAGVVYATLTEREKAKKDRYEADLRFERGPFLFQSEYIRGKDGDTDLQGLYGALGYKLGNIQPIFRIGTYDENLDAHGDDVTVYEGGANYYIQGHQAKVQLSFSHFDYDQDPVNTIIAAAQVAY